MPAIFRIEPQERKFGLAEILGERALKPIAEGRDARLGIVVGEGKARIEQQDNDFRRPQVAAIRYRQQGQMQPGIREVAEPITGDECAEVLRFGVDVASAGVLQRGQSAGCAKGGPSRRQPCQNPMREAGIRFDRLRCRGVDPGPLQHVMTATPLRWLALPRPS